MKFEKKVEFECRECGGHELGYQKYAKCVTPVTIHEDGHMEYGQSEIDEDDYLCVDDGYICMGCKSLVEHCGCMMVIEDDLLDYLTMALEVRDQQQREYEAQIAVTSDALQFEQGDTEDPTIFDLL